MFPHDTLTAIAVFLPAVIPAIWWGIETRRLLARTGDPLLPERLLAARRRASIGLMFCVGVIAGVMARALVWAVPFVLLSRAAAGFALRRRLYEETWPFAVMVSFSVRLIAAVYGWSPTRPCPGSSAPSPARVHGSRPRRSPSA